MHPHTWEFTCRIAVVRHDYTPFHVFERGIKGHLEKYQNKVMNRCPPFDLVVPTIENMTEMFAKEFDAILAEQGGELQSVEGSEGPTRSFIVTLRHPAGAADGGERKAEALSDLIDSVLDDATGRTRSDDASPADAAVQVEAGPQADAVAKSKKKRKKKSKKKKDKS